MVDIRVGDYDNTASLDKAMQGIEKVLLIASTNEDRRRPQHQNVVDVAKKAGVQCTISLKSVLLDTASQSFKLVIIA